MNRRDRKRVQEWKVLGGRPVTTAVRRGETIFWPIWTVLWSALLLFMILCPIKWGGIVEKVNAFSTRIGILSADSAAKANAFDKGLGLKILVLISLVGGIVIVILDAMLTAMTSG